MRSFVVFVLLVCAYSTSSEAKVETFIREYTYQASKLDNKESSRTIALQQVKVILLSELGTHISSVLTAEKLSDGKKVGKLDIESLSAGVVKLEILKENWDAKEYYLKARVQADPDDVYKQIDKMLDARNKQKKIDQLNNDLSQALGLQSATADQLKEVQKQANDAVAEIERLKKKLSDRNRGEIEVAYAKEVAKISMADDFQNAYRLLGLGEYREAIKLYRELADKGMLGAQNDLGFMYSEGKGVPQDYKQAAYWYQKAAEQGLFAAQLNLGIMFEFGQGVDRDYKQAAYWYQKATAHGYGGNGQAENNLGSLYFRGQGLSQDYKQAAYWYQKAADLGNAVAQQNLGSMYIFGQGVSQNNEKAIHWFQKAAQSGDVKAQSNLGAMYFLGRGVTRDYGQAAYWCRKAADQGIAQSQYILGSLFEHGQGVVQDNKQAAYWYQKAAAQGFSDAKVKWQALAN